MKCFVILSHRPSEEQTAQLRTLGVTEFITPPPELAAETANIDPDAPSVQPVADKVIGWLRFHGASRGDVLWIQGEPGLVASVLADTEIPAVYATTRREASERTLPDGSVKNVAVFRHVRFRTYARSL